MTALAQPYDTVLGTSMLADGRTVRRVTSLRSGLVSLRDESEFTPSDGSLNTVAESCAHTQGMKHLPQHPTHTY